MANDFNTVSWAKGSNIYEVNVRQYTAEGTFVAFGKHLPRLKEMGVQILWFMPITPISKEARLGTLGSYYACSSYTKINEEFGDIYDFKNLINEAHELGFKVIIDWVANHTGRDHEWTKTHKSFYALDANGNFTERNGWKDVIDLNFGNHEMRFALITAMKFWIDECNIDGFRCDMSHLVPLDFWYDARKKCEEIKPLFWLAECEETSYHNVFDATYAWKFMHDSEQYINGKIGLGEVYNVLHGYSQYSDGAIKLLFTTNHDENSWNGTEYEKYGNAAKPLAVFTCTWQGMPLIYSGQENANTKRLLFFDKDELQWQPAPTLHVFYKTLFYLRKNNDAISIGETFILPTNHPYVMAFLRRSNDKVALVILNFSADNKIQVSVQHQWLNGLFTNVFSGLQFTFNTNESFELMAYEYLVYAK